VIRIVSGGQTGVDRAALDWALDRGLECGGWCPAGRLSEDGAVPARYPLQETPSPAYAQRTEWNVRDSEATVLITCGDLLSGGTKLTQEFCRVWNRPCLWVHEGMESDPAEALAAFVEESFLRVLNVAGPRLSTEPGAAPFARMVLEAALPSPSR